MKKILSLASAAIISAAAIATIPACGGRYTSMAADYVKFGTAARLVVTADFSDDDNLSALDSLNDEVTDFLNDLERSLSTSVPVSYVSQYNAAQPGTWVEVDYTTYTVLSEAIYMYKFTGGYYNPAVYYSVDLYGFSPRFNDLSFTADISTRQPYDRLTEDGTAVTALSEPSAEYVRAFAELASYMSEVAAEERDGKYYAYKPAETVTAEGRSYSLALDLSGIGKGYAADIIDGIVSDYGFEYGFFSFGGSSFSVKNSYDRAEGWQFGIVDPESANLIVPSDFASVDVASTGMSTSGDYDKCYYSEEGGRTYCHIIDPSTGEPITTGVASCTLFGTTAARADALTTALMVMGTEKAAEFINDNLSGCSVVMLSRVGNACKNMLTNVENLSYNPKYTLINTISNGKIVLN